MSKVYLRLGGHVFKQDAGGFVVTESPIVFPLDLPIVRILSSGLEDDPGPFVFDDEGIARQ